MTYKPNNLTLDGQPIAGPRCWTYQDTGTGSAGVVAAEFFSDGNDKGMVVGDKFTYLDKTASQIYSGRVSASGDTGVPSAATVDGLILIGDTS